MAATTTTATMTREEIERLLEAALDAGNGRIADTQAWAAGAGVPHNDALVGLLRSRASPAEGGDGSLRVVQFKREAWELTPGGRAVLAAGSPEHRLLRAVPPGPAGAAKSALPPDVVADGFGEALKRRWLSYDKKSDRLVRAVASDTAEEAALPCDDVREALRAIAAGERAPDKREDAVLRGKRKLLRFASATAYSVERDGARRTRLAGDLTAEMLRSGAWREAAFKRFNAAALGAPTAGGHVHPLGKMRREMRQIFLEMGFAEMATDRYVESSFWNFDSLFQPQQHPARDMHDTFFLRDPRLADASDAACPRDYLERVRAMHERGGCGSIGWRYDWSEEEARKNIWRTHTTANSARELFRLAQSPEGFRPVRCFSIDRVFRNETLDATHLAEFHQVEGFIADYDIGLPHLIGTLTEFYTKLGMRDLRFKPAYNPYTEPSMEIFAYHPTLGRTIEIGNSGVFRPEMLGPMNLPPNVQVIAWGLSLERPTMIKYGIGSIRSLFGPDCSLNYIRSSPICLLDK